MRQLFVALIMYIMHRYLPNPSYTVPDTGLVLSTIIPSDDTVACNPDNVYYTHILTYSIIYSTRHRTSTINHYTIR